MQPQIRDVQPQDVAFIMDSWAKSWRVSPWAGTIQNHKFHEVHRETVEGLVGRGAKFKVLSIDDKPDVILGWVCYEVERLGKTVVHMIYVKDPYQAAMPEAPQMLLDACPGDKPGFYTHRTRKTQVIFGKGWIWAPEIARRK